MTTTLIELLPGIEASPLFKTEQDYRKFRDEFIIEVASEIEKYSYARAQSEIDSRYHLVD